MTDNELLLAISSMMDTKLKPIYNDLNDVKERLTNVENEVSGIKGEVSGIKGEVSSIKGEVSGIKGEVSEVKQRVINIELTQEREILPRLNTIESCYTSTFVRYKASVEEHEAMKQDISIMKNVLMEHSKQLQNIS